MRNSLGTGYSSLVLFLGKSCPFLSLSLSLSLCVSLISPSRIATRSSGDQVHPSGGRQLRLRCVARIGSNILQSRIPKHQSEMQLSVLSASSVQEENVSSPKNEASRVARLSQTEGTR